MGGEIGVKNVVYNAPKGERNERHNKKKKKGGSKMYHINLTNSAKN